MLLACGCRAQRTWEMEAVKVVGGLEPKKREVVGWGCLEAGKSNEEEAIRATEGSEPKKGRALEWGTGKCLSDIFKNHIDLPKDAAWLCLRQAQDSVTD